MKFCQKNGIIVMDSFIKTQMVQTLAIASVGKDPNGRPNRTTNPKTLDKSS